MKILSTLSLSFLMFSLVCEQIDKNNKPFKDDFSGIDNDHLSFRIQKTNHASSPTL